MRWLFGQRSEAAVGHRKLPAPVRHPAAAAAEAAIQTAARPEPHTPPGNTTLTADHFSQTQLVFLYY